jgi:hypothetical protein
VEFAGPVDTGDQPQLDIAGFARPSDKGEAGRQFGPRTWEKIREIEKVGHELAALYHGDVNRGQ